MIGKIPPLSITTSASMSGGGFIARAARKGINGLLGAFCHAGKFDSALAGITVTEARPGFVRATLPVTEATANFYGTLHGGATSTLVDIVGTMAVLSKDPLRPGVSVELNVSFCSAAKVGTEVTVEGKLLKLGRKLAYTQVDVLAADGTLVATGRHTKALL